MSGPRGKQPAVPVPLDVTNAAVPAYRDAFAAVKQAYLLVSNVRRDTTQLADALAQVEDARTKLKTFQAELEAS